MGPLKEKTRFRLGRLFTLAGLLFSLGALKLIYDIATIAYARATWVQTEGRITRLTGKGWWDEVKKRSYYIEYAYEVGGISYRNVRFDLMEETLEGTKSGRDFEWIASLRAGEKIPVYYNPSKPQESSLRLEYLRESFLFLYLAIGFLVMAWTMIRKESNWEKVMDALKMRISEDYGGKEPLPPVSPLFEDSGGKFLLDTSVSVFWGFGVPFFGFSFIGALLMVLSLDQVNPGWSLFSYGGAISALWIGNLLIGLFLMRFRHSLEIDHAAGEIRETSTGLVRQRRMRFPFSGVERIRLYQGTLDWFMIPQWTLLIEMKARPHLCVTGGHRDKQPADPAYLGILKKRMEHLIFGAPG
jgi:hypothetical protein